MRRPAVVLSVVTAAALVLALVVTSVATVTRVEARFPQPPSVSYSESYPGAGDAHVAVVVHRRSLLRVLAGVDGERRVILGSYPDGSYGHPVALTTLGEGSDRVVGVRWEPDGAWLDFGSGHRVFVPARFFIGGR